MAFTVEDGTGLADANSFATVAFYRDYHNVRGRDVPAAATLPDATIETWLVRATDYIVKRFGMKFQGSRAFADQALPMPRTDMTVDGANVADDSVPLGIQQATAEYAMRAGELAELVPDPPASFSHEDAEGNVIESTGSVISRTEKVGPLEESVRYASPTELPSPPRGTDTTAGWMLPAYPAADLLLEPYLAFSKGNRVIRN